MDEEATGRRWRPVLLMAVVFVLLLAGLAAVMWIVSHPQGPKDASSRSSASSSTTPRPSDGPSTGGTSPTPNSGTDSPVSPELPPVAPDQEAVGQDGVRVALPLIEPVQGEAVAPGEISGPSIRVTARITNGTRQQVDLGYAVVNAYIGSERAPASTLTKPGGAPFQGVLQPGESADGVYLFLIPEAQRANVTITVDYAPGVPTIVFTGSVG